MIHVSHLNFYSPSIVLYKRANALLLSLAHRSPSVCIPGLLKLDVSKSNLLPIGRSKSFLGFDARFCISGMTGSCLLQSCVEASTEIGRLIPDSKDLQIK